MIAKALVGVVVFAAQHYCERKLIKNVERPQNVFKPSSSIY